MTDIPIKLHQCMHKHKQTDTHSLMPLC